MLNINNIGVFVYIGGSKNQSVKSNSNRWNHSLIGVIANKNYATKGRSGNTAIGQP